jgi:hypothetical protein
MADLPHERFALGLSWPDVKPEAFTYVEEVGDASPLRSRRNRPMADLPHERFALGLSWRDVKPEAFTYFH